MNSFNYDGCFKPIFVPYIPLVLDYDNLPEETKQALKEMWSGMRIVEPNFLKKITKITIKEEE